MTSELERARAHLRKCQDSLASWRENLPQNRSVEFVENNVLAALSWVWEEQEKTRRECSFGGEQNWIRTTSLSA